MGSLLLASLNSTTENDESIYFMKMSKTNVIEKNTELTPEQGTDYQADRRKSSINNAQMEKVMIEITSVRWI